MHVERLKERIREALADLVREPGDRIEFEPPEMGRVVVLVVSRSFEDRPEEDRQSMVWGHLIDHLSDYEQNGVEYVFTRTLAELDPAYEPAE